MLIAGYSDFRQKLKSYMDEVLKNNVPLFVTRSKGENLVVIAQSEYESIMETFHLLKSPKNAERLLRAVEEDKKHKGKKRKLLEE